MPTDPNAGDPMMNGRDSTSPDGSGAGRPTPSAMPGGSESNAGMNRPAGGTSGAPNPGMSVPGGGMTGPPVPDPPAAAEPPAPTSRSCGVMDVHRRLLSQSAQYRANRDAIETAALEASRFGPRFSGVVKIPVVVHVVHRTTAQNISDAQVQSQIAVLNRDFRSTNPDVANVPGVFQPLVGDSRIEFFLAQSDPQGNPTTGITRTATTKTGFGTDDAVKFAAQGGADAWPADRYLNMWAAPLTGGLLGYAQFPGGPPETDGVVILTTAFGDTGNVSPPFHLGRTATHEVGHYLNLFHIWGDDGTGCSGSDQVDDTPNQGGPNTGVPTFPHVTCSNGPNGDLFMNYMDYVDDPAMVMFSNGQIARMQACLDGVRSSLAVGSGRPVPAGPALSWGSDRLDAFVLGTDHAVYHKWWDGTSWGPAATSYEFMGGTCMTEPEVASWGANRLDAFVLGTDRALYHKWWDGTSWGPSLTGYENLGGVCFSKPKVASWGENRLDVFVLGADSAVYHKWWDGNAWGPSIDGFESLGGTCASEPVVVSWGENRLDLFVLGTDNAVYHKWWDGTSWGPAVDGWEYMGGTCAGAPTAVAWGENRLDLFVLGTDHAVYHKWWDGTSWGPAVDGWEYMGGACTSDPTVVSWGPNRLDLFVTGTDSALYHKWWDGNAWGPAIDAYESLGGVCVGQPRVTSWAADRLDVFVTGTDSALYHKWWDGNAWGPSVSGYENLGGVISDFRLTDEDVAKVALPAPPGPAELPDDPMAQNSLMAQRSPMAQR